jgi:NitT/TauT family transport system ATP-binding protein
MSIELKNVCKNFNGQKVIDDFSLTLPEKGTVCFFGPSGCGKTTLLNCIAGLLPLDGGSISGLEDRKISCIFQEDRLLPWVTAQENVAVVMNANHQANSEASEWLRLVGLEDAAMKHPNEMSGGMRQRVSIARALAYGGDILLMDEPFHALDSKSRDQVITLINEKTQDKLKILVTHSMEEAEMLSDIIYFMEGIPLKILDAKR